MNTGFEVPSALTETYSLDLHAPVHVRGTPFRFVTDTATGQLDWNTMVTAALALPIAYVITPWHLLPPYAHTLGSLALLLGVPLLAAGMMVRWWPRRATATTIEPRPGALQIGDRSFPWHTIDSILAGRDLLVCDAGDGMTFTTDALVVKTRSETLAWRVTNLRRRDLGMLDLLALEARLEALRVEHSTPEEVPAALQQIRRTEVA